MGHQWRFHGIFMGRPLRYHESSAKRYITHVPTVNIKLRRIIEDFRLSTKFSQRITPIRTIPQYEYVSISDKAKWRMKHRTALQVWNTSKIATYDCVAPI